MLAFIIITVSAVWVYWDTTKNKIGKISDNNNFFNLSAGAWSFGTLFLWILVFPAYLIKRKALLDTAHSNPQITNHRNIKFGLISALYVSLIILLTLSDANANDTNHHQNLLLSTCKEIQRIIQSSDSTVESNIDIKDCINSGETIATLILNDLRKYEEQERALLEISRENEKKKKDALKQWRLEKNQ